MDPDMRSRAERAASDAMSLSRARRVLNAGERSGSTSMSGGRIPRGARWQHRLERPRRWMGRRCHANHDTLALISSSGFQVTDVDEFDFPPAAAITRLGVARSGAS
jgi:hypothetical protein